MFDINNIWFTVLNYPMSYIEFFATIISGLAVWLSTRANSLNWPLGLTSIALLFLIFFQINLYPDMFLQVFFFVTNIIGWYRWTNPKNKLEENENKELKISHLNKKHYPIILIIGLLSVIGCGFLSQNLHIWLPNIFTLQSSYPFLDSFVLVFSIIATFCMIEKKIEAWILWIAVDILCTYIYFQKGIKLLSIEYFIFCLIAIYGFIFWYKELKINKV